MRTRPAVTLIVLTLLAGALGLAACGSSSATTKSGPPASPVPASLDISSIPKDPSVAALLPPTVTSPVTVGTNLDQVQLPYVGTGGTGLQADLRDAVGRLLGITFTTQNSTFAQIIPGVQDSKYQVGMANFGVTQAREQVVDFVTYLNDGQSLVEASGDNLTPITGPADVLELCGKTVATGPGTTFQELITQSQPKCQAAGKPQIKLSLFDSLAESVQALQQGRADVYFGPTAGNKYLAAHTSGIKFLSQYSTTPVGFVFSKASPLEKPIQAAVNALIANGDYAKILAKWDVADLGVSTSQLNPSPNF